MSEDSLKCAHCGKGEGFYQHAPFDDSYHEFSAKQAKDKLMSKETISMKEAVARAIYCAEEGINEAENMPHVDWWFNTPDPGYEYVAEDYRKMATAAIKAMRDIPMDIKMAGASAITADHMKKMANYDAAIDAWQAMIDAALSQE